MDALIPDDSTVTVKRETGKTFVINAICGIDMKRMTIN